MKTAITYLTLALCLTFGNILVNAETTEDEMTVVLDEGYEKDKKEEDPKGLRMPMASMTCIIHFTTNSIETNRLSEIISYELWDEEGEFLMASYISDSDMVALLSTVSGVYQFRITTAETIYVGYIEL